MRGDELPQADPAADVERVAALDVVPTILEAACQLTGMGFAAIARVTDCEWTACAVRDEIAFGLEAGGKLELTTTLCNEVRGHGRPITIDEVATDPDYRDHHTPRQYGFQSYISIPIVLGDGRFFGTLCAIHPEPARVSDPTIVKTFKLFAQLIARELDSQERLSRSESALLGERTVARLRDQFIAVLGHDLRNPLASMDAGTHMLSKEPLAEQPRAVLRMMQASCRRMTGLIDNVLDFARGQLGGGLPTTIRADVDLHRLVEVVVGELRLGNPEVKVEWTVDLSEPVACDPHRIAQLLSNLVSNALTHGDPLEPVRIAVASADGAMTLTVANRGKEIPADLRDRLFEPFVRPSRSTHSQGLGLGLYIVSEIAKAHHGAIRVQSDDSETRFELTMPAVRPDA